MDCASVACLLVQIGLYAAPLALLGYAAFGRSRLLVFAAAGSVAAISARSSVALPAAIAAKLAEPETPVVCLTGDGGLLMRLGDLETAAREGAPIVVVVFNDGYLNLIKIKQDKRNFTRRGTGFMDSDYVAASRGLGFEAVHVETEEGLRVALDRAIASGGPWVIDAAINPDGYIAAKDVRPE